MLECMLLLSWDRQVFLINSTPTQPCLVTDRTWLSDGMDAALVLGPTGIFNQLHPNPVLLRNGSDVVEFGMDVALVLGPTSF